MNPDRQEPQLGSPESRIEAAEQPKTFLDKIRKWANSKIMIAATVVGLSGAAACDVPAEQDGTEQPDGNQNELYQGCEPFSMCNTTGLFDSETNERIGFSFWYKVPEGQEFDDVTFKVLDANGGALVKENLFLTEGTGQVWVIKPGYEDEGHDAHIESEQAPTASGIEVTFIDGEVVTVLNKAPGASDDDAPSIGQ